MISCAQVKKFVFVSVHSLLWYIKCLISLKVNNLYILHCNGPLVSNEDQYGLMKLLDEIISFY